MLKRIFIVSAFVLSFSAQAQCSGKKTANFLGINPSVTIEPFYEKGEFDLNVFPIVYQKTLTKRFDFRISTTLNYGVRKTSKTISHIGGQLALPIYLMKKNELINPSSGFFLAPGVGFTRNTLEKHSNIGVWLEPGYNLQISERWTISFGIQLGATHFNYDNGIRKWGNHFGIKIFLGRWF